MSRLLRILPLLLLIVAGAEIALAEGLIPVPEVPNYQIPTSVPPAARSGTLEYLDLAFLLVALSLASYLALVKRSRRGLFALAVISFAWLGVWREGCVCPIGAIQNVSLAVFDASFTVPLAVVAFFALPLVFTLFFGRTFCAAVCPLGAIQEFVAVRPLRVPAWLDHTLGLLAYVYLGAAVVFAATGAAFVICRYDPFVAFFRQSRSANMLIFGGCFLVVGLFVGRPYCRYFCPYGVILGLLSKVSKWHVKIPPEECIQCRLCEEVCPYGAIREPTVDQPAAERRRGRRRLALLLPLLPGLVVMGTWLGTRLKVPLSRMDPTVRLAERVWLEETDQVEGTTEASEAFRDTGRPVQELYRNALKKTGRFGFSSGLLREWWELPLAGKVRRAGLLGPAVGAGGWLGAWVGLVIGLKLIHLSIRRRRTDYQTDRTSCVSCGRCFWYCPNEQARLGLVRDVAPPGQRS